jgi:pimeloyl-ACP methyl ester carboxylesterase
MSSKTWSYASPGRCPFFFRVLPLAWLAAASVAVVGCGDDSADDGSAALASVASESDTPDEGKGPAQDGTRPASTSSTACTAGSRGRPISTEALVRLTRAEIAAELRAVGLPDGARYAIDTYRLTYCTVSPSGQPTAASGLLALPRGKRGPLQPVLYEHSSSAAKTEAPSYLRETEIRVVPFFFAADGFAVVAPDYLGLGTSSGRHPYLHASSEASSSLDMLPAAEAASVRYRRPLSRQVFVTGFSQGGQAAMAVGQAMQRSPGAWRLIALAPMAGPYDMSGAMAAAILDPVRSDQQHASFYLSDIFTAWKGLYGLYADPNEVFEASYADMVEGLFDGGHSVVDIDAVLPTPAELFHPEALRLIANPSGRYAAAARDNDVCRWAPSVPTRLYASHGDRDVTFAVAEQCRGQIEARGGTAQLVDMGEVDHVGTAVTSIPLIRAWFTELATR